MALTTLRAAIARVVSDGFEEGLLFGMPSWYVPLRRYPDTYNGKPLLFVSLASQKQYMALYLTFLYQDPKALAAFEAGFRRSGKKLDMGKSCVRFRSFDELPLDVITRAIAPVTVDAFVRQHEQSRASAKPKPEPKLKPKPKKI